MGWRAPRSGFAVKHRLTTNAGVIDADYTGEVKVVLVNQGDQPYDMEKHDRIPQLIIEKINTEELQEVVELGDTNRGNQGFGSTDTKESKQRVEKEPRIQINEISARAFGQFYRGGETTGVLRWDEIKDEIRLEHINISTELAIKNKKQNEGRDLRSTVPREYH